MNCKVKIQNEVFIATPVKPAAKSWHNGSDYLEEHMSFASRTSDVGWEEENSRNNDFIA